MKLFKNYQEDDVLAKVLFIYLAVQHSIMGAFLVFDTESMMIYPSVQGVARLLPVDLWGSFLLASAVLFIATIIQENKLSFIFMITAGLLGMVTFGLLAMAGIELSSYRVTTIHFIVVASVDCIVTILGGVALWLRITMFRTKN